MAAQLESLSWQSAAYLDDGSLAAYANLRCELQFKDKRIASCEGVLIPQHVTGAKFWIHAGADQMDPLTEELKFCRRMVSYFGSRTNPGDTVVFISNVSVLPNLRSHGLGKAVLEHFIAAQTRVQKPVTFFLQPAKYEEKHCSPFDADLAAWYRTFGFARYQRTCYMQLKDAAARQIEPAPMKTFSANPRLVRKMRAARKENP